MVFKLVSWSMLCLALLSSAPLLAQRVSGGFKAGLNFNSIRGPEEMNPNGDVLERINGSTGFHIGAIFALPITDLFGLKGELMYSQKGAVLLYEGPSYFFFYPTENGGPDRLTLLGERTAELEVTNSYIDIPLMAYGKLWKFEFEAGVSVGVLVGSVGSGGTTFQASNGTSYAVDYNFNYNGNRAGAGSILQSATSAPTATVIVPESIGAYYDSTTDKHRFNRIDLGLVGGVSFFINRGLFLGARINYGISDISRSEQDFSIRTLDANAQPISRDDRDQNISLQTSIGFRF